MTSDDRGQELEFLVVVTLPGTPEHFTRSCSGTVTIGRSENCGIQLAHPLVSRNHTEITKETDGRFLVRDLGSRNGTTVNGQRVRASHTIVDGETSVQVGPYMLIVSPSATTDSETVLIDSDFAVTRLSLDRDVRALKLDGDVVIKRLSVLEYRLVDALDASAPRLVENESLGNAVWGQEQWDVYMLHNLIRRVRRKLEAAGVKADEVIATVPGVGYHLV